MTKILTHQMRYSFLFSFVIWCVLAIEDQLFLIAYPYLDKSKVPMEKHIHILIRLNFKS